MQINAPFALENDVRHALDQHGAGHMQIAYHTGLSIRCDVASAELQPLRAALAALGRGKIELSVVD